MRKVLVNALSVTNPSGRHVLLGHLDQLVARLVDRLNFTVLCRAADRESLRAVLGDRVKYIPAPESTRRWLPRVLWERLHLAHVARQAGASVYFTPSGIAARLPARSREGLVRRLVRSGAGLLSRVGEQPHTTGAVCHEKVVFASCENILQVVFCQNPWALVPAARRRRDAPKAWLQRRAYRRAMRVAGFIIFNSRYMQEAYRANAGCTERRGLVVYQAPADSTRARAAEAEKTSRRPGQILSVSVMGPHKNIEAVVAALAVVRRTRPDARLVLAGSWPDAAYERTIRNRVADLGLTDAVEFAGFVDRGHLENLYAQSRVFCLMSRCESFGIPAIEAQLFGTPVVASTVCAMPEIGGEGGLFRDPDDGPGIAAALETLLADDAEWQRRSRLARENAARFTWAACSRPLVDLFGELAVDETKAILSPRTQRTQSTNSINQNKPKALNPCP